MRKLTIIMALVVGLALSSSHADVIVGFDFATCTSADAVWSAATVITGIDTATPAYNTVSRVGVTAGAAGSAYGGNAWNITETFDMSTDYISFTVTPSAGNLLTLSFLTYAINGSSTGPRNGRWGYSTDSGSSFNYQTDWTITSSSAASTSWDFVDFSTAGAVEFRFWSYGTQGIGTGSAASGGTVYLRNITGNDLILDGTLTPIPEPASIGLLLLGLTGIRMFARRRQE